MSQGAPIEVQTGDRYGLKRIPFHVGEVERGRTDHQRHVFRRHNLVARGHRQVVYRVHSDGDAIGVARLISRNGENLIR